MAKYSSDTRMYQAAMKDIKDQNGAPFYDGPLDGNILSKGANTRKLNEAVNAFQKENKLAVKNLITVGDKTFQVMESKLSSMDLKNMNAMKVGMDDARAPVFSCDDALLNLKQYDPVSLPLPMYLSAQIIDRIVRLKTASKFPVHFEASDCDINSLGNFIIHFKFKDIKWLKFDLTFGADMPWPATNELIINLGTKSGKIWQYDDASRPKYIVKSEKAYPYLTNLPTYDANNHPAAIGLKTGVTHVIAQKACVAAALNMKGGIAYKSDTASEKIFVELTSLVTGLDANLVAALKRLGKSVRSRDTFGGFPLKKFIEWFGQGLSNMQDATAHIAAVEGKYEPNPNVITTTHIPYNDGGMKAGNCTIGYGKFIHRGICIQADYANPIYQNVGEVEAQKWLVGAIDTNGRTPLDRIVFKGNHDVMLTKPMYDALVSLAYNLTTQGHNKMKVKLLNFLIAGNYEEAANELLTYHIANKKVVRGLMNRRVKDRDLFLYGRYEKV